MIDRLSKKISAPVRPSMSAEKVLIGGDTGSGFGVFVDQCHRRYSHLVSNPVIDQLCVSYGDQISKVMQLCETDKNLSDFIPGSTSHIKAQLMYELNGGSVFRPGDFIHRRSFLGSEVVFNKDAVTYCCETINRFWGYNADIEQQVAEMLGITLY
jgi:glycerol-3-phosphate dehydrogenase